MRLWLQELYHPVVAVAATPAADNICLAKNGLSLVDVLRPFSQIPALNGAVPWPVGRLQVQGQGGPTAGARGRDVLPRNDRLRA